MNSIRLTTGILILCLAGCVESGETADGSSQTETGPATDARPEARPPDTAQLEALRARVNDNAADAQSRRKLAIALLQAGQREESIEQFKVLVELTPGSRSLLDLALAYNNASRLAEAEQVYQRILELSPDHHIALHNLGNLAVKRGNHEGALEFYTRAVTAKPDYLMAYAHLADALKELSRFEEAYQNYDRVLMLEPKNATELELYDDALYQLASLDLKMGATQRAMAMLTELLKANPDHPKAHYAMGQALLFAGKPQEAQREFDLHMEIQSKLKPQGAMASSE